MDKIVVGNANFIFENNVMYEDCLISLNCVSDKSILQNENGHGISYTSRYVSPNLPRRESFVNFKDLNDSTMIIVYYVLSIVFMLSTIYLLWLKDGKKIKMFNGVIILLLISLVVHFVYKKMKN